MPDRTRTPEQPCPPPVLDLVERFGLHWNAYRRKRCQEEFLGHARGTPKIILTPLFAPLFAPKNEIMTALNKPEQFILAVVEVDGDVTTVWYVRRPFTREPDFGVTSVNYKLSDLVAQGEQPA